VLRLFLALHFLFFNLYACKGGYASCIQKAKDAHIVQKEGLRIPLKNAQCLLVTKQTPSGDILKYDPFLSLYLLKDSKPFAYPYDINMHLQLGSAIVNDKEAKEGRFLHDQIGLNSFAKYNQTLPLLPALISSSCCSLEGIATVKGVIQKEYVKHFLQTKQVLYSDIGIRVFDKNNQVIVNARDPFMKDNPFKVNDCIIMFDEQKVQNASVLMRKILFSSLGSKHTLKVKRGAKFLTFKVQSRKRFGGGFLSDTFLEQKGIYFDKTLHVSALKKEFRNYGLKIGDRLIQVNGIMVNNQNELRHYIENFKDYSSLLFERNNFQFFVNIK